MLPKIITDIQIGRFKVSIARLSVRALDSLNSLNLPVLPFEFLLRRWGPRIMGSSGQSRNVLG